MNRTSSEFPVTAQDVGGGPLPRPLITSAGGTAFIRLAQGVVGTIWRDLGALNQSYVWVIMVKSWRVMFILKAWSDLLPPFCVINLWRSETKNCYLGNWRVTWHELFSYYGSCNLQAICNVLARCSCNVVKKLLTNLISNRFRDFALSMKLTRTYSSLIFPRWHPNSS